METASFVGLPRICHIAETYLAGQVAFTGKQGCTDVSE
jgi:hypothetical protein